MTTTTQPGEATEPATIPQPGDVVQLAGPYWGADLGARAVIDGSHYRMDFDDGHGPRVLAVFAASAFRGPSRRTAKDQTIYVSCSGGPCPLVPLADLTPAGTTDRVFWRWIDGPRAHGGENYTETVPLWTWSGQTDRNEP